MPKNGTVRRLLGEMIADCNIIQKAQGSPPVHPATDKWWTKEHLIHYRHRLQNRHRALFAGYFSKGKGEHFPQLIVSSDIAMRLRDLVKLNDPRLDVGPLLMLLQEILGGLDTPNTQTRPAAPPKTGPADGFCFWWEGKSYDLQPRLWRLLDYMWTRNDATEEALVDAVWGENGIPTSTTVRSATSQVNHFLAERNVGWTLCARRGHIIKES